MPAVSIDTDTDAERVGYGEFLQLQRNVLSATLRKHSPYRPACRQSCVPRQGDPRAVVGRLHQVSQELF